MDAQNRILYAMAWSRQTSAAATPAPTAAPTSAPNNANTTVTVYPPTLYANVSGKAVRLEWTTVSGATNYSLYRRRTNYDKNFQLRQELPADLQRFGAVLQGHVGKCELQLYLLCCRDDQGRAAAVLE